LYSGARRLPPCGLHHLVLGAAEPIDVAIAKAHRDIIIHQLGQLKALQIAVPAVFGMSPSPPTISFPWVSFMGELPQ